MTILMFVKMKGIGMPIHVHVYNSPLSPHVIGKPLICFRLNAWQVCLKNCPKIIVEDRNSMAGL